MKKNKYILPFALAILFLGSCSDDFLDRFPLDRESNETFWLTEADAMAAATGCYSGWWSINSVLYFDCASDNAFNPYPWEGYQTQASGAATPQQTGASFFGYGNITRFNDFLENISRPTMNEDLRKRLTAEVRFLRAFDYFTKVNIYGDVPLVTKVMPYSEANVARTPRAEVVQFIIDELAAAAADLPVSYSGSNVGRITKGAALALKARMELFDNRFAESAVTSSQVMELGYSLVPEFREIFYYTNQNNPEVILDVQYIENLSNTWVLGVLPPNSNGGWSSINPTQALVDAFEMSTGKTIDDPESGYDPDNPYNNRDPRMDATIVYPGAWYEGKYFNPIDPADPHGDFYAPYGRSKTGYNPRKYADDLSLYPNIWNTGMNSIVIRYAEVLLMYAEAKIESNSIDQSVYDAINMVRTRGGMPEVDQTIYNNQSKLRELIRRERRVELAMEGLRWFDIVRWQIGEEVMPGMVYGARLGTVDPETGELELTDTRIEVETRLFDPSKNYRWPIPQGVIDATPAIIQNPVY